MVTFDDLANENFFPGNRQALGTLASELATGRLVAFVGSGISIPLAPSWGGLLTDLIDQGLEDGSIAAQDQALLRQQIIDDPLELASTLEEAFTTPRFRSILSQKFRLNDTCTIGHELVVSFPLQGLFTLNYDDGLSTAFVRRYHKMPTVIRPDDRFELHRWALETSGPDHQCPIIHWHGTVNSPDRMVLTADDYDRHYSGSENKSFIEELWRGRKLFVVGFGFRDPILTRLAETVIRASAADNQHIALIGRRETEPMTTLLRRSFSKKFRVNPVFYQIHVDDDGREDHREMFAILEALQDASSGPRPPEDAEKIIEVSSKDSPRTTAEKEFKDGLFVGPSGQVLYAEPKIVSSIPPSADDNLEFQQVTMTVGDLVAQNHHTIITVPLEAGGTTLARRLALEFASQSIEAIYRDANKIGNYKNRILEDRALRPSDSKKNNVLLVDNFDPTRHDRMLKELIGLGTFARIILISRARTDDITNLDDLGLDVKFQSLALHYLDRSDIRTLASQLYDTFDGDLISAAVEKTYNDLLDLCIPLTPSNVVMYLSVVHREGSFTPLNRLSIMDRFIRDMLHRPSDLYRDSFNVDNKLDVISAFVFHLFKNGLPYFNKKDWDDFCDREMKDSLIWFDKESLLEDLEESRLLVKVRNNYLVKYKLFYSYFVGKFVAARPPVLNEFLKEGKHLALDSLVEIIAGSSKDNTQLIQDLVTRLEESIGRFEKQYELQDFDPYEELEWSDSADERVSLWQPITEKIASGPAPDSEVDKLKRSIIAESRTSDQNVVIREFSDYQRGVSYLQIELIAALRESQKLDRDLKARSIRAIYKGYHIAMQIGFLFSPIIATRRFFVWNDVAFYNHMNWPGYADASVETQAGMIAAAIPRAIVNKAADELGSRKLGALFEHMAQSGQRSGFDTFLTYALILRAKPIAWDKTAKGILDTTDRTSAYLRYMLGSSMRQFNQEVNTTGERSRLKRIIATIQAKRHVKKANPNNKVIDRTLKALESERYFDKAKEIQSAIKPADIPAIEAEAGTLLENNAIDLVPDQQELEPKKSILQKLGLK